MNADSSLPGVTGAELEVLKLLWDRTEATARELVAAVASRRRPWAHTTVLTLLNRLEQKGFVEVDRKQVAHVFRPSVRRDELLRARLDDLTDELCDGVPGALVRAFVKGRRFSASEIRGFRALLDGLESRPRKRKKKP